MKHLTKLLASVLSALGLNQAAWTNDVLDSRETLQLAERGNAQAQFNLGMMYENGQGVRQDDAEAVKWYRLAAEQGFAQAQSNLGVMYDNGQGVRQDYAEALRWYRKAAEQGVAEAQYNLGVMYDSGRGVRQDLHLSKEWFGKACDGGFQEGCDPYRYLNQAGY